MHIIFINYFKIVYVCELFMIIYMCVRTFNNLSVEMGLFFQRGYSYAMKLN